jgi:hypothetical protein
MLGDQRYGSLSARFGVCSVLVGNGSGTASELSTPTNADQDIGPPSLLPMILELVFQCLMTRLAVPGFR